MRVVEITYYPGKRLFLSKNQQFMKRREFIGKSALAAGGMILSAACGESMAKNIKGKTMKVLLVNGSPHQNGNTAVALQEISGQLKKNGIESEIVWIGNRPVRGCIACGKCKEKPGACIFNDDVCNEISAKYAGSDALIVGSPVYYGQPNGALLSIIQRSLYSNGSAIAGKPAAVVAVCRRGGATASFETLNMPFQMMNMPIVSSQYWNIVYGRTPGEASLDAEGMQTMRTLANNMAFLLQSTGGKPAPGSGDEPWKPMHFIR